MISMVKLLIEAAKYEPLTGFPEVIYDGLWEAKQKGLIDGAKHREFEEVLGEIADILYKLDPEMV